MNKTTVVYHSADYDGIFCREIAKKALGEEEVTYLGWNFGDVPLTIPKEGKIIVMDLPPGEPFGLVGPVRGADLKAGVAWDFVGAEQGFVWIDHHKTSIEEQPTNIPGYQVDGVAACRLAWQWFFEPRIGGQIQALTKQDFIERKVDEPLAVRLAGEYDVWDKRDPRCETFQYALRCSNQFEESLQSLLEMDERTEELVKEMLKLGAAAQHYAQRDNASLVKNRSFMLDWEGMKFLALNTARCNSLTFAEKDRATTGHDALMGFYWNGTKWVVSLYHAKHRTELDLSNIAKKHGGGGHRGACGFQAVKLPWLGQV